MMAFTTAMNSGSISTMAAHHLFSNAVHHGPAQAVSRASSRCRSKTIHLTCAHKQQAEQQQQQQQQQQHHHHHRNNTTAASLICASVSAALLVVLVPSADAKLPPLKDPASNVGFLTNKEVDKRRKKANFVRGYDGHVSIQNRYTKAWTDVKCDLQVPGLLLLRDASGEVYYLGYGGLKQIDLSDDQVVAAIATDDWENAMKPVEGPGEKGEIERLGMTREGFYQLVSLTSGEDFEAELQEQAAPANNNNNKKK